MAWHRMHICLWLVKKRECSEYTIAWLPLKRKIDHVLLIFNAILSVAVLICAQAINLINKIFLAQREALLKSNTNQPFLTVDGRAA